MINSPIKWVGGKSRLRKYILPLIPEHSCYVDVFGGAGWVLFGKEPSQVEILNDIDQELINFFRIVKHQPEELIASFEWELVSRAEFNRLTELDLSELDEIQRAHRFFYIIMAGWGGELNYPRFATSISDGGHGNRLFGAIKRLRKRIEPVHKRLQTVIIENLSWQECVDKYDRDNVVMYFDPPYPSNGANYKHNMRSWEEHQELAERLSNTTCKWLLSSYNNAKVRELYDGYHFVPIQSFSGMANKKNGASRTLNDELLITNFMPNSTVLTTSKSENTVIQARLTI